VRPFATPIRRRLHQNLRTRFFLGGRVITSLNFTIAKSLYSTMHHLVKFGSSQEDQNWFKLECIQTLFYLFSNQVYECMYGNLKYNHAIKLIQVHNIGKEGQCEFWGIYQNFTNMFGSQINSNLVQKQFSFQNFYFKSFF
jgi:hypothetical protein